MGDRGSHAMPRLKWGLPLNHATGCAVQAIHRCMRCLSPESEVDVGRVYHATHGLHDGAIIAFCHAVHLRRVSGGELLLYSFLLGKGVECVTCILATPVASEDADFGLSLSFELADEFLEADIGVDKVTCMSCFVSHLIQREAGSVVLAVGASCAEFELI